MGVTETMMHTLYADGINKSELVNGEYQAWESISQKLNIGKSQGGNPFIAPDESYILFGRRRSSIGSDIFISFKNNANQWSEPKNLSKAMGIETAASQPIISPDGKYLFYYYNENIYWISTEKINEIKTENGF